MGSEYSDAIDMFVAESRVFSGAQPRGAIVIHKTAGGSSAQAIANYFATNDLVTSSHFVIGRDGVVVQCVSLNDGAAANCCLEYGHDPYWDQYGQVNLNLVTISIEHVDPSTDNSTKLTDAQLNSSIKLCLWLRDNYNMQWPDVKTHASIAPSSRARCPGNYPMDLLTVIMKVTEPVTTQPTNQVPSKYQSETLHNQWRSCIDDIMTDSGIYKAWVQAKLNGKNYNAPVTREYKDIDWNGNPIISQDGGNWHAQWDSKNGCKFYEL